MTYIIIFIAILGGIAIWLFTRSSSSSPSISFDPGRTILGGLNLQWDISYRARSGESTNRRITVKSLHGETYPKYAYAFCHLRQEYRHFNLYNVLLAIDVKTKEDVPVTDHLIDWISAQNN